MKQKHTHTVGTTRWLSIAYYPHWLPDIAHALWCRKNPELNNWINCLARFLISAINIAADANVFFNGCYLVWLATVVPRSPLFLHGFIYHCRLHRWFRNHFAYILSDLWWVMDLLVCQLLIWDRRPRWALQLYHRYSGCTCLDHALRGRS